MDWNLLKEGECPKCGKALEFERGEIENLMRCNSGSGCDFSIRETRLKEIIDSMDEDAEFRADRVY